MRSTRVDKKQRKRETIRRLLLVFIVIIPLGAICSSFVVYYAMNKEEKLSSPAAVFSPAKEENRAFKYSFDVESKELYRVEIKKYDNYQDAEGQIVALKNKKLNGFIIKENGYLAAYGIYMNKSQADTAVKYLKRRGISSTVGSVKISQYGVQYDDMDKTLIDIAKATDTAIMKIAAEKAALSLECLYSDKNASEEGLKVILENEGRLEKYLSYLKTVKTSENTSYLKDDLETLIHELLYERLNTTESYSYYEMQNSLLNQMEILKRYYDKLAV